MPTLTLEAQNAIAYEWAPPAPGRASFVFFNPLTGDFGLWQAAIARAFRQTGLDTQQKEA